MKSIKIITLCMLNIDVDCNPPQKKKKTAIKTQNYKIKLTNLIS